MLKKGIFKVYFVVFMFFKKESLLKSPITILLKKQTLSSKKIAA